MTIDVVKVFLPAILAFFIGIGITPILSHYFFKYKLWKKSSRSTNNIDVISEDFKKIHNEEGELGTPRVGGMLIWLSALLTISALFILFVLFPNSITGKLEFVSRNQTLIPIVAFILAALIGLVDDLLQVSGRGVYARDGEVFRWIKIGTLIVIGLFVSFWFYFKLDMHSIHIPFGGELNLGILFIPFFILVMLAVFSSSVIDGIDGLSGGVLAPIFLAYAGIAFSNNQIDLAAFSAVIAGATLAFLWFNIPPARFYMGETGMLSLTVVLAVIAFMTNSVLILPIVAMPLVLTSLSVILQMLSRKFRNNKRIFKIAPLHHHFEAIGWPKYKVTMRFWVLSIVFALVGMVLYLIS
ncbi:MAG: hypothetical protein WC795_00655 [Candidatus Paceibacterota bacterium]|jgi:phospho-N-acetylmuramoyl-pentapeptide-transferase